MDQHFSSCSRRAFLGLTAASAAALTLPASESHATSVAQGVGWRKVKGFCPFCQTRCTYHALVESTPNGDRIRTFVGDKGNRWTGGSMCPKGLSMVDLLDSPHRLTRPMRRTPAGWEEISYAEAVRLVADTLLQLREKYGKDIGQHIAMTEPLWDCRESELAALMTMRFAGCVNLMPPGEVCISTSAQVQGMLLGSGASSTTVNEVCNCKTLILWGANINELYPPYTRWLVEARNKGVEIIYIDCRITKTSQWCSRQLMPVPGTDGALALGAMQYVLTHKAYDEALLAQTTVGLDTFAPQLTPWTVEAVAAATGLTVAEVTTFYETICQSPATIVWLGGALCRYTNGMTTVRAITSLQVLTGNMIGCGKGIINMQGGKPEGGSEFVDMVCGRAQGKGGNFRRLTAAMKKGSIDVLFLNSSYRRYPDAKRVAEAIKNVPLVVHSGFFMTEEMDVATLFIPAAFGPESEGSHYALEKQVVWRDKIVDAPGQCVPCWQFFRDVGYAIEPDRYPRFERPAELYEMCRSRVPSWKGMTLERLKASPDGVIWPIYEENGAEQTGCHFREGKYFTADGRFNFNLSVLGPVKWALPKGSPRDANNKDAASFPLILVQGKKLEQWQQTLTNFSPALAQYATGRTVTVHPATASRLQCTEGSRVRLETTTGAVEAVVHIDADIREDCVFTPSHMSSSSPFASCASPHINTIIPNYWDRVSAQFNGCCCRLVKI